MPEAGTGINAVASSRADAFPTLKLMERVGVLDDPTARAAFVEQKLID